MLLSKRSFLDAACSQLRVTKYSISVSSLLLKFTVNPPPTRIAQRCSRYTRANNYFPNAENFVMRSLPNTLCQHSNVP
jgi:hypothetical protein